MAKGGVLYQKGAQVVTGVRQTCVAWNRNFADRDERSAAPVVSLSLGESCVFRFGNTTTRNRPWTDIELESGDLFVFGGQSRLAYHGVPKLLPGTGDTAIGLSGGRYNITLRQTGLPVSG